MASTCSLPHQNSWFETVLMIGFSCLLFRGLEGVNPRPFDTSLTRSAASRVFHPVLFRSVSLARTPPICAIAPFVWRMSRRDRRVFLPVQPNALGPCQFINSVLPTKHLSSHCGP
jgi:hypothetical protein